MMETKKNCANLFTIDFSSLSQTVSESAFTACKKLLTKPSNCIRGENASVRVVLIATHEIDVELFAYHLKRMLLEHVPSGEANKILVFPVGVVYTQKEISAFWRYA
jgi:glucuronate isomerase